MTDLLDNPAIQAGVAPFAVALVAAALLARSRFLGLAIGAAFATVVALTIGFSFGAMTSVQKLVLIEIAALVVVVPLELWSAPSRETLWRGAASCAAALSVVWVIMRMLQQQETLLAILGGTAAALYVGTLVYSGDALADDPVHSSASALVLGLGSGALALLGASASLAQLGIGIGAGAGAVLFVQVLTGRRAPPGRMLALPAYLATGLIATLAVATGSLPWYAVLPLLAVPWAIRLLPLKDRAVWLRGLAAGVAGLAPILIAVLLAWNASRPSGA